MAVPAACRGLLGFSCSVRFNLPNINIKELCENALLPKIGVWDPAASTTYKEDLVKEFGGSAKAALTGCREKLAYGDSPVKTIIEAVNEKVELMTGVDFLLAFFSDTMKSDIAKFFMAIMVLYFLVSLFLGNKTWFTKNAVIILPTVGILGTFVGVYYSLQHFNLGQLDSSIDEIVRGLKIAFTTSIAGMGLGVIMRFANSRQESKESVKTEAGADDIHRALIEIRGKDGENYPKNDLSDIHKALAGEGDVSISTQIMKMRQDLNDFAKTVAEANTSALIDALKDVIKDFNEKMSEQFGENFKQLNVAVGRLLEWQENYKEDLDYLRGAMKDAVKAIEASRSSIEKIAEATGSIPDHMKALENILDIIGKQIADLEERLGAFAEMKDKAQEAFPRIEDLLTAYTDKLEEAVTGAMETLKTGLEAQNNSMDDIRGGYSQLKADIENIGTTLGAEVKKVLEESLNTINASITSAHDAQKDHLETVYTNLEKAVSGLEESYNNLRKDADDASKVIVDTVKTSAEEHGRFVKEVHEQQMEGVKELQGAYTNLKDQADESAKIVVDAIGENKENIKNAAEAMEKSVEEIGPTIKSTITNSMEGLTASLDQFMRTQEAQSQERLSRLSAKLDQTQEKAVQSMENLLQEEIKATNKALEKAVGNAVKLFDQHMGSLAEHVAQDYRPLVEAMRRIIAIADTLERERQDPEE